VTSALAILFMLTSLTLTILASQRGSSSVVGEDRPRPAQSAPREGGAPASQAPSTPTPAAPEAPKK
jgi:preprotein translocase subunit SecG